MKPYRNSLVEIASNPRTFQAWLSQRPSDRIIRFGQPRFVYVGHGKSRRRRAA